MIPIRFPARRQKYQRWVSPLATWAAPLLLVACIASGCERSSSDSNYRFDQETYLFNLERERFSTADAEGIEIADYEPTGARSPDRISRGRARRALKIEPGHEVRIESVLRPESTLRFELGIPEKAPIDTEIEARIAVRHLDGSEETVWTKAIRTPASTESPRWMPFEVSLDFLTSKDLVLSTAIESDSLATEDLALLWGEPVLRTEGVLVESEPDPPECVIVFLVDTLRADHLALYDYHLATSPSIGALAEESLLFMQATAAASWTKPSVASLFTSRHPPQHGVEIYQDRMRDSEHTLAEVFEDAGYITAALGQNIWVFGDRFNLLQGFQQSIPVWHFNGSQAQRADKVVDQAMDWVTRHDTERFFLYVQIFQPHHPYDPPPELERRWVSDDYDGPLDGSDAHVEMTRDEVTDQDLSHIISLYDAEIAFADQQLGRFIAHLRAHGLWDESTFVLLADHGEEFLDHGGWLHERDLYEELVHVPLLVKPPASSEIAPTRISTPVSLIDVAPTLCRLARVPSTETSFLGQDLVTLALDPQRWDHQPILSTYRQHGFDIYSVRRGDLKYIRQFRPVPQELAFRLNSDPGEETDIFPTLNERVIEECRAAVEMLRASRWDPRTRIDIYGDGQSVKIEVDLRCDNVGIEFRLSESEGLPGGDWFRTGPIQKEGIEGTRIRSFFSLGEDDRQDGIHLQAGEEDEFLIGIRVDGEPIEPARILYGGGDDPLVGPAPTRFGSDPRLRSETIPAPVDLPGIWCRIWWTDEENVEIDEDTMELLRALGYFGGDD